MQQETIVHFVGFITDMGTEEFTTEWESYAQTLKINKTKATLYKQIQVGKNSFRYIAKFELPEEDFQLPSINDRKPVGLSETRIRAMQLGGYGAIQQKHVYKNDTNTTIITFVQHNENDIAYYSDLPLYSQLTIHQAYYENSSYGYIMEFIVPEQDAQTLLQHLEKRPLATAGLYRASLLNKRKQLATSI
jgi:hypothetical protein